jgi:hypothetical protein
MAGERGAGWQWRGVRAYDPSRACGGGCKRVAAGILPIADEARLVGEVEMLLHEQPVRCCPEALRYRDRPHTTSRPRRALDAVARVARSRPPRGLLLDVPSDEPCHRSLVRQAAGTTGPDRLSVGRSALHAGQATRLAFALRRGILGHDPIDSLFAGLLGKRALRGIAVGRRSSDWLRAILHAGLKSNCIEANSSTGKVVRPRKSATGTLPNDTMKA